MRLEQGVDRFGGRGRLDRNHGAIRDDEIGGNRGRRGAHADQVGLRFFSLPRVQDGMIWRSGLEKGREILV